MKKRVLLLNNVPAPYFTPLFEKIGRESGWQLTVCYSSDWNRDVGWQAKMAGESDTHQTAILDRQSPCLRSLLGSSTAAAIALFKHLILDRPAYLICYGYTLKPQIVALMWAMGSRTPCAVIGDANYYIDSTTGIKRALKSLWLKQIVKRAAALVTIGTASRLFWQAYGAQPKQLFESRFAVDNEFYAQAVASRKGDAAGLRDQWGLTGKVVFLFVGRLVKRKNVDLIIKAARQLNHPRISVVIAGSGGELEALKLLAAGQPQIVFAGNVAPPELPLYYAAADVLILPADQEPWGLVVNEAMACGLAVIAHQHCGAAVDLVDQDNGVRLESFSVDELARAMQRLADDCSLLQAMQQCSREKIQGWSIEVAARGMIRAVETSCLKK